VTRIAALIPTHNRASSCERAVTTYLRSTERLAHGRELVVCIVDDSTVVAESENLRSVIEALRSAHPHARIDLLHPLLGGEEASSPQRGAGAARNRGLQHLASELEQGDIFITFDDDVCFSGTAYQGEWLCCDGMKLIDEALLRAGTERVVAGCDYVGRQDLSILEHLHLADRSDVRGVTVKPAMGRGTVQSVAPGGISSAFLACGVPLDGLPTFLEHYNEDYIWLRRLTASGWRLEQCREALVHAPPETLTVTDAALAWQIFGEIVWLVTLETDRYPISRPDAMADAVDEIAGDLRAARARCRQFGFAEIGTIVERVLLRFESIHEEIRQNVAGREARLLVTACEDSLRYVQGSSGRSWTTTDLKPHVAGPAA